VLRFLPQAAYESAAPLDISPVPDIVTRVFMLFQGVRDIQDPLWSPAAVLAKADPSFWKGVVGIDESKQMDSSLFRVLEWGGMEVIR